MKNRSMRPVALPVLLLVGVLGASRPARSDTQSKIAADAAFEEGKRLMNEGKFAEACPRLAESNRLDPGSGTLLWLGDCYEKIGRTASAWSTYKEAASLAATQGKADREKLARERVASLESSLVKLTIQVTSSAVQPTVKLDDTELGKALWGSAMPIDPGKHSISASATGKKTFLKEIEVTSAQTVLIPALENEPTVAPPPGTSAVSPPSSSAPRPPPPAVPPSRGAGPEAEKGSGHVLGYTLGGVGLLAIGSGVWLQLGAKSKADSANEANDRAAHDSARSQQTAALLTMGLGGALLTGGIWLLATSPSSSSTQTSLQLVPSAGSFWGLTARGNL